MMRPLMRWALALVFCASCSPGHVEDEETPPEQAGRFGLVSVTYGHDWVKNGEGMLLTTAAQFVRYSAMHKDQVARLLALPLDPDRDLPPVDRCKLDDLSIDLAAGSEEEIDETGMVELLEAGDLQVQTQGNTITLAPKHFPGLLPFISGVVYSEAQADLVQEAGAVAVNARGTETVGSFSAQGSSPVLPKLIQLGTTAPTQGSPLSKDVELALGWQTPNNSASDILYLELRYARDKRDLALRCRLQDDGSFSIPQSFMSEVSGPSTLELARLRRSFFSAQGLDQGELRVTIRDIIDLQ